MARYQIENPEVVEFISESEYNSTAGHNTDSRPQPLPSRRRISLSGGLQPSEAAPTWGGSSKFADSDPARAPLLGAVRNPQRYHIICYHKQICLRSRPVLLVLLWNFFISFSFECVVGFTVFYLLLLTPLSSAQSTVCVGVSIGTATLLLFPIAIYLADIKFKRHKVILASVLFALLTALIIYLGIILLVVFLESGADLSFVLSGVVIGFGGILFLGSYIAFTANVVQFGMDQFQAQDVHKEGPVLFVHWYVWTSNLGNLVWKIDWGTFIYRVLDYHYGLLVIFTFLIIIIIIGASACFAYSTRTPSIPNFASSTNSYSNLKFIKS